MKVIDLLNKIANGEKVPKKIKYCDEMFMFTGYDSASKNYNNELEDLFEVLDGSVLNDEVEIIEEKEICHKCHKYPAEYNQTYCEFCLDISKLEEHKIPEKIKIEQDTPNSNFYIRNEYGTKCALTKHSKIIANKINEIIDYLEEIE